MLNQAIKGVLGEIKGHIDATVVLNMELRRLKSEQFFTCPGSSCGKRTKVKNVPLISKFYYTQTNAGAGSYWSFSEHNIVCPKCGWLIRANTQELKYFIEEHRGLFREEVDWYPSRNEKWNTAEDLIALCKK